MKKESYVIPELELVQFVQEESILQTSGGLDDYNQGGGWNWGF